MRCAFRETRLLTNNSINRIRKYTLGNFNEILEPKARRAIFPRHQCVAGSPACGRSSRKWKTADALSGTEQASGRFLTP